MISSRNTGSYDGVTDEIKLKNFKMKHFQSHYTAWQYDKKGLGRVSRSIPVLRNLRDSEAHSTPCILLPFQQLSVLQHSVPVQDEWFDQNLVHSFLSIHHLSMMIYFHYKIITYWTENNKRNHRNDKSWWKLVFFATNRF